MLRAIAERQDLTSVVLVVDNAPCHGDLSDVFDEPEFASASNVKLGPYSPMLNPIESGFSTYTSAVKRFLTRNRRAIQSVLANKTIAEHRSHYLLLATNLILSEIVTEELCRACHRHVAPFQAKAFDREDMPVGQ